MTEKRTIDWERIELDYRAGILSLREIASPHDVTEASVRKRAKRDGWTRDLSAKIKAKADLRPVTLQDPMSKSGFVYVIYLDDSAGERFYKIGMSDSFSSRFSGHQCSSPFLICVACAYFTGSMRFEERGIHEQFKSKRVRGEWFRLSDDDLSEIAMRSKLV